MTIKNTMLTIFGFSLSLSSWAGTLDSPAAPSSPSSAMHSLENIYQRLDNGATGAKRGGAFTNPGVGPGSTGHTLDEVMNKAPEIDNTDGAGVIDVQSGKTFWGLKSGGGWGLLTGTASGASGPVAPVEKSGQTTSYQGNDDGDLEKGIAWPSPRFTDHSNGTATDNLTGLMWLKDFTCPTVERTWAEALSDVSQLNSIGTMNSEICAQAPGSIIPHTGWRLPNVKELYSLIDFGNDKPTLPTGHPFVNVPDTANGYDGTVWSSNTAKENSDLAYEVDFKYGHVGVVNKTPNTHLVMAVRDAQ